MLLLFIPCASAEYVISFKEDTLIAGSTYEVLIPFDSKDTTLNINVTIESNVTYENGTSVEDSEVWMKDWNVSMFLDGKDVSCNETSAGVFNSSFDVNAGTHEFNITFKSVVNVMPGNYIITIYYPDTEIITQPPKKSSGGGRRYYPTPTPTPSPVNATPEPTQTAVVNDDTNVSDDNVSEAPQEPDKENKFLYGLLGIIAAIILIYLYSLHKKQE